MPKCSNTHSECEILIAFTLQQWLHERTSMLRYAYSTLPVLLNLALNGSDWTASRPGCFIVSSAHWVGGPVGCRSPLVTLNWKNLWSCDPAAMHTADQCVYDNAVSFVFLWSSRKLSDKLILSCVSHSLIGPINWQCFGRPGICVEILRCI